MNRINERLSSKDKLLSIYFTAGFPELDDTAKIINKLADAGVDMIEIGLPFSDPLADGPTIQQSSTAALNNGMSTEILFEQLKNVRQYTQMPLLIMGYFNPILQYGVERFCSKCSAVGIDGLIIPDLPLDVYQREYRDIFERYSLANILLITPQTSEMRIGQIDAASNAFIYLVSSAAVTGGSGDISADQREYFNRIRSMKLQNPQVIGFGIKDRQSFEAAVEYASGAIIGSAFIKHLSEYGIDGIGDFIRSIRLH